MTRTLNTRSSPDPLLATAKRFAVIGHPVKHSRSPAIHHMFAAQRHIALTYARIDATLEAFKPTVMQFFSSGGAGLNVTVPFKLEAWELARTHLSKRAQLAQAVNTLWWHNGAVHGCNTDGVGLVADLQRLGVQCAGARILMVGAGGAARGVLGPLLETGCRALHIVNRSVDRGHALVAAWHTAEPTTQPMLSAGHLAHATQSNQWDLVINATASSLAGEAPALPAGLYAPGAWAVDMMYAATPTAFMRQAQADGAAHCSDGLGMLVGQAAESFYLWHGQRPDVVPVLAALRTELSDS